MSVAFENKYRANDVVAKQINNRLVPPRGWLTAEELQNTYTTTGANSTRDVEKFVVTHLPLAAKRAERLIDALKRKLNIEVPESYLRVRNDAAFQVLLLVSTDDFVSPKMAAARLLAEEFADTEAYDMNFVFSVISQSVVNNVVLKNNYKLKHFSDNNEELARVHIH